MSGNSRAFDFVRTLAAKLGPELELPAFPDVVRRLQMALLDEQTALKDVVNLIGSEPVLSARLMQMANSAALNPSGTPVASLNNAVSRLGFNLVRTVATAFALRQLSRDETLGEIRPELEAVWRTSNEVAAVCYGVARQSFGRQSDEAMMVGLLHSIGRLYIIMHAHKAEPALREDPSYQEMLGSWQPIIGRAILEACFNDITRLPLFNQPHPQAAHDKFHNSSLCFFTDIHWLIPRHELNGIAQIEFKSLI